MTLWERLAWLSPCWSAGNWHFKLWKVVTLRGTAEERSGAEEMGLRARGSPLSSADARSGFVTVSSALSHHTHTQIPLPSAAAPSCAGSVVQLPGSAGLVFLPVCWGLVLQLGSVPADVLV